MYTHMLCKQTQYYFPYFKMGKTGPKKKKNSVQSHPEGHVCFCYIQKAPEVFAKVFGENIFVYLYIYIFTNTS